MVARRIALLEKLVGVARIELATPAMSTLATHANLSFPLRNWPVSGTVLRALRNLTLAYWFNLNHATTVEHSNR